MRLRVSAPMTRTFAYRPHFDERRAPRPARIEIRCTRRKDQMPASSPCPAMRRRKQPVDGNIISGDAVAQMTRSMSLASTLAAFIARVAAWLAQRRVDRPADGNRERPHRASTETTASLASHAATRAMKAASVEAKDIDLVICATASPEMMFPSTGCFRRRIAGHGSTPAFDLCAACSGFLYALDVGASFVKCGRYANVLVIGAETLSRITTTPIAAVAFCSATERGRSCFKRGNDPKRGVLYGNLHADGTGLGFDLLSAWQPTSHRCDNGRRPPAVHEDQRPRGL